MSAFIGTMPLRRQVKSSRDVTRRDETRWDETSRDETDIRFSSQCSVTFHYASSLIALATFSYVMSSPTYTPTFPRSALGRGDQRLRGPGEEEFSLENNRSECADSSRLTIRMWIIGTEAWISRKRERKIGRARENRRYLAAALWKFLR